MAKGRALYQRTDEKLGSCDEEAIARLLDCDGLSEKDTATVRRQFKFFISLVLDEQRKRAGRDLEQSEVEVLTRLVREHVNKNVVPAIRQAAVGLH